jgi:hypothetical protein
MSYYDSIYEYAADNYGIITTDDARQIEIPSVEMAKLAQRGRLVHVGQGVYKIRQYIPTPLDAYAEAVAIVGHGAYIYGESVLAMHGLAFVNPTVITVAVQGRNRRTMPPHIKMDKGPTKVRTTFYEGIPSQSVFDAILACKGIVMTERLDAAVTDAEKQGLLTKAEADLARKELFDEPQNTKQQKKS